MDFASIPFQTLLIDNAENDQLVHFLQQLDKQYTHAADEKARFGILQILLPIFKAHMMRLNNAEKERDCIRQYLQPWIESSFSQDSMISTESVGLLEKTVSFMIGRSMILLDTQDCFGQTTLITMLAQLVSAMEAEPDFVDLKPLDFIDASLVNEESRTLWDRVVIQQSCTDPPLDLECCLDTLNLFVRDLNESEELLALLKKSTAHSDIEPWMNLIFSIAVGMIPCTDSTIRNKLAHDLLPNLLCWQQNSAQRVDQARQVYWCELLWKRTLAMFGLPATNLLRLEIYGLIARFFDYYFGLNDSKSEPIVRKDLRFDVDFFKILQNGLGSNDSLSRKYSTYILKRIIDFSDKHPSVSDPHAAKWTPYFKWDTAQSQTYLEHWDDWFLLYDTMHESVIHLVDPILPRFETLLKADFLDASWWILLFHRGFQNDISSVRKGLLEYIFSRQDADVLNKLGVQQGFMLGALFKTVDNTTLFQVPTQGTMVSPFGEHFRFFLLHLINAIQDKQEKVQFLRQLMHHISHVVSSYIPILYAMEALAEVQPVDAWGPEELKSLRVLVDRHRNFNIPATKQFLRKLGIAAVVRLANTASLSFSDVAKTISSLVNEYPIKTNSAEFKLIRHWLEHGISKDQSLDSVLNGLRDRFKTYIYDLKSQDIPEAVLRTQANVLARTSVFVVSDEHCQLNPQLVTSLLSDFSSNLKSAECEQVTFGRLLTLLNALWDNFDSSFVNETNFLHLIGISKQDTLPLLKRIDDRYLNKDEEEPVDDDVMALYLSLSEKIILGKGALEDRERAIVVKQHYDTCLDLLKYRPKSSNVNHEMSKPSYISLLKIVYKAARVHGITEFDCNDIIISLVYSLPMKRTQEALRERTWGDCMSRLIRSKWECIESIIQYAIMLKNKNIPDKEFFDPVALYQEADEQLETSSEMCGEAIIRSFGPLLAFPWTKTPETLDSCVEHAIALMNENVFQSRTYPLLIRAFIDVIFQPELLSVPELNQEDGPIKKALNMVIETGQLKPFIMAQTSHLLHQYWSTMTKEANESLIQYAPEIAKLLVFGPLRDRDDQKIEAVLATKLASPAEILEAEGTAETMLNQNDYLVRVDMNDILLRLDIDNKQHRHFANLLLEQLLHTMNSDDNLFEFTYTSTIEHRLKLRMCCSILLIIDFAEEAKLNDYLETMFELMRKETIPSIRCYVEWSVVRLLRCHPQLLPVIYNKIADPNHKPNFIISLITVTFSLCDVLPENMIENYFGEIFVRLTPWLITNHFTIRLFSYCSWRRNYKSCIARGFGQQLEDNKYLKSIGNFMETYADCIKFFDKIQAQFYMSKFDPVQDFNVEFIFRQMMTEFQVIDNEKIGSKAFIRLNPQSCPRCPFENPARKMYYTSADPSEMIGIEEEIENEQKEANNTAISGSNNTGAVIGDDVYQKKIMPWEMMLETDMDLTKNLHRKNRRSNDLIVVASLVDRLPNLAGLCRTCEIFNASQLVVPSLKIKDDVAFTSVSVASERWMPMIEVAEPDVATFLQNKKEEGYTLCGLEQTTTSATLGEYEFPEKCVLLLGKERQGVPADLLQMLDVTIEIPQYGITRSLNVHVSGAICIYEYTKQMHWRQQQTFQQQQLSLS
ncbi:hypothetical protein [Parasitella parasitica]|uniref:tRNA (guanosine(18)-2'-O)-methyltransferase TARBP1 n=1 Tax=Parasitella parasitica TaxID=35722 RepID=A0A0B7NDB9_9FUNG|nr:hypothetical protein [Parasitella parasitica]